MAWLILTLIFLVGLVASLFDSFIGGGGGTISVPALIFFGLPINMAVPTNRLGVLGTGFSNTLVFLKNKKIIFKYLPILILVSIVGSIIGANIFLSIDKSILSKIIGIMILLVLPIIFIRKDSGLVKKIVSKTYNYFGYISYFILAIYDGFFGVGAGIVAIYIFIFLFGTTIIEANALDKIPWFINVLISTIIFAFSGLINYIYGLVLLLGMLIGGYFGARIVITKGNIFVKAVFSVIVVIFAIKLLFF